MSVSISNVVDGHLHLWDRSRFRYAWLENEPALPWSFLPDDLDMEPAAAIVVQADCEEQNGIAEARWMDELSREWPPLRGFVASAPLERGRGAEAWLAELVRFPVVRGVRRLLQDESDEFLAREELTAGLRAVAAYGLTFDACVRAHQMPALLALRRRVPELTVVLDHLGKPPVAAGWRSAESVAWGAVLREFAAEPNTLVKLSGLAPEAGAGAVLEQARPFLEAALESFGPSRCLAGSDWPVSSVHDTNLTYAGWFDYLGHGLGLDALERDEVMHLCALRTYGVENG